MTSSSVWLRSLHLSSQLICVCPLGSIKSLAGQKSMVTAEDKNHPTASWPLTHSSLNKRGCLLQADERKKSLFESNVDWCVSVDHYHWLTTWWHHQMETFSMLLVICKGNPPVTGGFPSQRPVTRSFDVCFDLRLNKWLSTQWRRWWFEMPLR